MRHVRARWIPLACLAMTGLLTPRSAQAQVQTAGLMTGRSVGQTAKPQPPAKPPVRKPAGPPKWRLEFHLSAMVADHPGGGTGIDAFPAGATFTTVNSELFSATRSVPSWYFGDGAVLFNQVRTLLAGQGAAAVPELVPLDEMLRSSSAHRKASPGFGFRFARQLTPKIAAEFSFDRNPTRLELTAAGADAVEASRLSFLNAFNGLVAVIPQTGGVVTSTTTLREEEGAQTLLTGALVLNLWTSGKLTAHAIAGVGTMATSNQQLTVELRGNYRFNWGGTGSLFNESDFLSIELTDAERSLVGVFGGGITWDLSRRQGLRADVRILAGNNGLQTLVDASPFAQTGTLPDPIATRTNPAIQFSNQTGVRSSLSDTTTNELVTFSGGGFGSRVQLGVGYFVKF